MTAQWQPLLHAAVGDVFERVVAIRRRLHAHPEPSGEEYDTSLYLYQLLDSCGFHVRMGPEGVGVLTELRSPAQPNAARCIALRADIDALRIHEENDSPYRSQTPGIMHACGHDAHTAVVMGALLALRRLGEGGNLPYPIHARGIFQPAEETCEGACRMIEVGAIEGADVILSTHVDPTRTVGQIGFRTGALTANCDEMRIVIDGRGGHAARPHETSDPIAAAAQLINALYLFVPRATDSQEAVVVTIAQVLAGHNANVIPERVELRGTLRTLNSKVREQTMAHVRHLSASVANMSQTRIETVFSRSCRSVVNDGAMIELLRAAAQPVVGGNGLQNIAQPSMGSEDFAFYLAHTPGAMIRLGCAADSQTASPLHSPTFEIDERCLAIGAEILAGAVLRWSDPQASNGNE